MRRMMLATLLLLACAAPVAAAAPYTVRSVTVNTVAGPNHMLCAIAADLYTPSGVDRAHPAPAILATNGFGGSKADFSTLGPAYATRGYVFLAYSGLGFGGSRCKIELDQPIWDGEAASQMLDFLAGKRHSTDGFTPDYVIHDQTAHDGKSYTYDPRVGMIGGSYGGEIQFATASLDPRLDTIVPEITWNNLGYSLAPNNTANTRGVDNAVTDPGVEKFEWTSLFFTLGIVDGFSQPGPFDTTHLGSCENFDDAVCPAKEQMDLRGFPNATTQHLALGASVTRYMAKVDIPTFLAQGEDDTLFNLHEATATYDALRAQGTPVKMLWKSDGHSGSPTGSSEDNAANPEAAYASRAYLEWFDYYLRGLGDPPALDFSFFRDFVNYPKGGDAAPAVTTVPAYPAAADARWYLSGSSDLVSTAGAVKAGTSQFAVAPQGPTSYSETSAEEPGLPPTDAPGTFAAFSTPALSQDTDVVGLPSVTVHLDAPTFAATQGADPGGRLVLFAKLYDVAADGTVTLPDRLVSPVRISDVTKPVTIALPGIVHRFAKNHTIALVLAASDAAYRNNTLAGPVTVTVDPASPSILSIPVLGSGPVPEPVAAPPGSQSPGAGVQSQVVEQASSTSAATLPRAAGCTGNRTLRIRLRIPHGRHQGRILSAKITVNGKLVKTLRTRRQLHHPLTLKGLPRRRTFRVVVTELTSTGRHLRSARTYNRTCH